jgi:hypothetical protein
MQELAGRLTALDPQASETLKVISYFDALVAGGAGLESIVRAAAVLSGVVAGAHAGARRIRVGPDGRTRTDDPPDSEDRWPSSAAGGASVWIEREGPAHANDAMILERLSLAVAIVDARRSGMDAGALETALDAARSSEERSAAVRRLGLDAAGPLVVSAHPVEVAAMPGARSTIIATPDGLVRAAVAIPGSPPGAGRAGSATATDAASLPAAWRDARLALRLSDRRTPVVVADDLGAMMILARSFDPDAPLHPDAAALLELDERSLEMLDELVAAESVRAAASALGVHHSSLQSRHEAWTRQLGYNPRSASGRARYEAARLLSRLAR